MQLHTLTAENHLSNSIKTSLVRAANSNAIVFNLSKLGVVKDNNEHVSIAANILRDQLKNALGDIYIMSDGDIILVLQDATEKQIAEAIYQIQYMFADDLHTNKSQIKNEDLYKLYNSSNNWPTFISYCKDKLSDVANDNLVSAQTNNTLPLLDSISDHVEGILSEVDWDEIITTSSVGTDPTSEKPFKAFDYIHVNNVKLNSQILKDLDFENSKRLLTYASELIDIRLLIKLVKHIATAKNSATQFDISIDTLKRDEFKVFSESIGFNKKRNLIIGLHISDIYKSLEDYYSLREELSAQGFKFCLNGLDNISFLNIDRQMLGFDLLKLNWQPALMKQSYEEHLSSLKNKVQVSGTSRVIFSNCDSSKALEIGRKLGINLFQGSFIDNFF